MCIADEIGATRIYPLYSCYKCPMQCLRAKSPPLRLLPCRQCSSASRNRGRIVRTASPCARHASLLPGTEDTSLLVQHRVVEPSALTASMSYPWRLCQCHRDIAAFGQLFHAEVCSPVEARVANLAACVDEKLHCKSRVTLLKLSASFFGGAQ